MLFSLIAIIKTNITFLNTKYFHGMSVKQLCTFRGIYSNTKTPLAVFQLSCTQFLDSSDNISINILLLRCKQNNYNNTLITLIIL